MSSNMSTGKPLEQRLYEAANFLRENDIDPENALFLPGTPGNLGVQLLDQLQSTPNMIPVGFMSNNANTRGIYVEALTHLEAWIEITKRDWANDAAGSVATGKAPLDIALAYTALYVVAYRNRLNNLELVENTLYRLLRASNPVTIAPVTAAKQLRKNKAEFQEMFYALANYLHKYSASGDGKYKNLYPPEYVKGIKKVVSRGPEDRENLRDVARVFLQNPAITQDFLTTLPNYLVKDLAERARAYEAR